MDSGKKKFGILTWLGIAFLQLIMTQVVTFLVSLLFPALEDIQHAHPTLFAAVLGFAFTAGVYLMGWLALKRHWLATPPRYLARLAATLIGAALPLALALILYQTLEPGNPFFFVSMLTSVLGFHIPGWLESS